MGAGRGGGLLFCLVLLFVAYLAYEALAGVVRLVVSAAVLAIVVALGFAVLRRR